MGSNFLFHAVFTALAIYLFGYISIYLVAAFY